MAENSTCINCNNKFELRNRGYKRTSIDSHYKLPAISIRSVLQSLDTHVTPDKCLYVCNKCASSVVKVYKSNSETKEALEEFNKLQSETSYISKRKRPLFESTPQKHASLEFVSPITKKSKLASLTFVSPKVKKLKSQSPTKSSVKGSKAFVEKAVNALRNSQYFRLFKLLYEKSKSARQGFAKFTKYAVRYEMKKTDPSSIVVAKPLNEESLRDFSWNSFIKSTDKCIPTLTAAVKGALTATWHKEMRVAIDERNHVGPLLPAYGVLLANILHLRFPTVVNFMQDIISVEMYRSGCNHKIFRWFNKLGLCRSITTTQRVIDILCSNFDSKIRDWQHNVQVEAGNLVQHNGVHNDSSDESSEDGSSLSSATARYEDSPENSVHTDNGFESDLESEGTSQCADDLDGIVPLLESSVIDDPFDQSLYRLDPGFSLCWDNVQKLSVTRNKVGGENKMMLWALSFATRNRIGFMHFVNDLDDTVPATEIQLHNFLPMDADWERLHNRMSIMVERTVKKHFQYFQDADVTMHIEHKYSTESSLKSEIVNLGVLKENPASCRGVIEIMKFLKNYVPVSDVNGKPIPIVCNGDQLSVERMITARLAMAVSEVPEDMLIGLIPRPQGFHKRCILLQDCMNKFFNGRSAASKGSLFQIKNRFKFKNVKKKISDCVNEVQDFLMFVTEALVCLLVCHLLHINSTDDIPELETILDKSDLLHHISDQIIDIIKPNIDQTSINTAVQDLDATLPYQNDNMDQTNQEVEDLDETIYFADDTPNYDSDNEDSDDERPPTVQDNDDHIFMYTCSLLWTGLKLIADKDAERENDGVAMLSDWRINMVDFWENRHNKYLILGHRLLAAVAGWLPHHLREDLTWNSTANLSGGQGNNLALDLVNEFQNNEFKGNLKNAHGQYSDKQVQRCSRLVGSLGKGIEEIFAVKIMSQYAIKAKTTKASASSMLINKFIKCYLPEQLFSRSVRRHHPGFQGFTNTVAIYSPENLSNRLKKYSKVLDDEQFVLE